MLLIATELMNNTEVLFKVSIVFVVQLKVSLQ